jgi:hypothetical protein
MARIPRTVYKYRRFSAQSLSALCEDQLYYSTAEALNDPFECAPSLRNESDLTTLRALLTKLVSERTAAETKAKLYDAYMRGTGAEAHSQKVAKAVAAQKLADVAHNATNPDFEMSEEEAEAWLLQREIKTELLRRTGKSICSLSASYKNTLLWSHYGDEHAGFCVGYSRNRKPIPELHCVTYGGSRELSTEVVAEAVLANDLDAQQKVDEAVLLRKSRSWSYEREWRLIGSAGLQDSPLFMVEVIFGLRCPVAVKHAIVEAFRGRDNEIQFSVMRNNSKDYTLRRQRFDLDEMPAFYPRVALSLEEMFPPIDEEMSPPPPPIDGS